MAEAYRAVSTADSGALSTNKVLRNTYFLLSLTLLFSAVTCGIAIASNASFMAGIGAWVGGLVMIFVTSRLRNSVWGIAAVFALTGLLGFAIGPTVGFYLAAYSNGPQLVMGTLGATAAIFLGLSAYVLTSRKDFSFLGGFLMAGLMLALIGVVGSLVMSWGFGIQVPVFSLALSGLIVLLMTGFILYDTSRIIHGGETNYILATVALYTSLWSLFINLLHLVFAFFGED